MSAQQIKIINNFNSVTFALLCAVMCTVQEVVAAEGCIG